MATKTKLEVSSFVKGLITEAGPLTFPDNASLIDENMVLNKDGSRQRRLGLNINFGSTIGNITGDVTGTNKPEVSMHLWKNPTKTGAFNIVVVQTSKYLNFYKLVDGQPTVHLNGGASITLPSHLFATYDVETKITTASLLGQLVLTYGKQFLGILEYNELSDVVTATTTTLSIRDTFGIESVNAVDYRPTYVDPITPIMTDAIIHTYNIRNQGWPLVANTCVSGDGSDVPSPRDPAHLDTNPPGITYGWPSNADVFWRYRMAAASNSRGVGCFNLLEVFKEKNPGTSYAPRGQCLLDIFDRSTSRQAFADTKTANPLLLLPTDISTGKITQIGVFSGRYFYAVEETTLTGGDIRTPRISNLIFFSQVVKSKAEIGKCYTAVDPTAENLFAAVDTDGGYISLPDAGTILKLVPLGSSLFVFATNGVWEIFGVDSGFSATNQNVTKTSTIGALSGISIIESESVITYWANSGIMLISIDPMSHRGVASNITITTIQTLYNAIPLSEKVRSRGAYDEVTRKLRWLYSNTETTWPPTYNMELVFDADLKAFYTNKLIGDSSDYTFLDIVASPNINYLVGYSNGVGSLNYSFGSYYDTSFYDFGDQDSPAVLLSGYLTGGTGSTYKHIGNLVTHFKRTETGFETIGDSLVFINPSGCIVTPQWEWTNSLAAGKWGAPMQMYRLQRPYYPTGAGDPFDYSYTVITSKSGIRGRGHALSLKFESEAGKDMHILGWGLEVEVESKY